MEDIKTQNALEHNKIDQEQIAVQAEPAWTQSLITPKLTLESPESLTGKNHFPISRLTPKLRSCIRAISQRSQVGDGMVIGALLTGVSAILLPSVTVRTDYGKTVGINLYAQTNAPPSSRKSDMYNPTQQILVNHDVERRKRFVEINQNNKIGEDVWKVRTTALKKQMEVASKKNNTHEYSRLEHELSRHLREKPISLPNLQILQGDVTPAAIMQALSDNQGCSTILIDEGLLLYQKILNNEIHLINSAWSGAALNKTTMRSGNLFVEKPRLTFHAFIQDDVFNKRCREKSFNLLKDSGFFSRVLICAPEVGPENNQNPEFTPSEEELNRLIAYLKKQLALNYPLDGLFSGEVQSLTLSPDAKNLVRVYSLAIQTQTQEGGFYNEMPGFCGKAAEHIHRLAGLIHHIEREETNEINYASVSAAIATFDWYLTEHWRLIVKEGRPLNIEMAAQKLIRWMRYRQDRYRVEWISRADIPHHVECFRGDPDLLDDVIRYLQQSGDIDTKSGRRRGRKGGYRWHDIRLSDQFERGERYMPN